MKDGSRKVRRVSIGSVAQRVDAALFSRASLSEVYVQVRVCCVVLADCAEKSALIDLCADSNPFGDTLKVEVDQKYRAVARVLHLQDDMARTEAAGSGVAGPARSPIRDPLPEGFRHFVSSMPAPVASGWSDCRVGLAPTGKRRLVTAHPRSRLRPFRWSVGRFAATNHGSVVWHVDCLFRIMGVAM
jgi:hypothetical protein